MSEELLVGPLDVCTFLTGLVAQGAVVGGIPDGVDLEVVGHGAAVCPVPLPVVDFAQGAFVPSCGRLVAALAGWLAV